MNRREFVAAMMAGGVMTATGLWMPGDKVISIPSSKYFVPAGRLAWMEGDETLFYGGALGGGKSDLIRLPAYFDNVVKGAQLVRDIERV